MITLTKTIDRFVYADREKCESRVNEYTVDYSGLSDEDKMILFVFTRSKVDYITTKKAISKELGWSIYKVEQTFRKLEGIMFVATAIHDNGGYAGKGYCVEIK